MEYFGYIVLSIVILLCMVLIHELGHYVAAKLLGFTVEEFSVGFGPKLISKKKKNGEVFSLRLLPLGGYCSFLGDESDDYEPPVQDTDKDKTETTEQDKTQISAQENDEDLLSFVMRSKAEEDKKQAVTPIQPQQPQREIRYDKNGNPALTFYQQKPWKRIIVLLGGVVFNFLSAIIFSLIYIWAVGCPAPLIHDVYTDASGNPYCALQKGDVIIGVNGKDITLMNSYNDLSANFKEGQTVKFKVNRDGKIISVEAVRQRITTESDGKKTEYIGFGFVTSTTFIGANAGQAFKYCVPYTFKLSWSILGSFGQLITGRVPITSVSGPVGSIKLMADVTIADGRNILILLPLLASNLAMFNILPFPALDGAQIIFTIVEWIRKKPLKRKVQGIINAVGLLTLLLFVVIVDILSFAL